MATYAPGTPSWIDLGSPDAPASAAFYGGLFGWEATEPGPAEETGGYRMFLQGGRTVAGLMAAQSADQPPAWSTYVSVADADAVAEAVTAAGGGVIVAPMDVMDLGRMAFFADPAGAAFGVWQPRAFAGADLVNEPVSLTWNELRTRDPEGAARFYASVFGWQIGDGPADAGPYRVFAVGDRPVAGMLPMGEEFAPEIPPHWSVCFAVADLDAVLARAGELGATLVHGPMEMSVGRFASLVDPQGAAFDVMQPPA